MPKTLKFLSITLAINLFSLVANAASGITYHGRILRSNGDPVNGQFVGFRLRVMDGDSGVCQMYEEIQTKDMRASAGVFSIVIGDGSVVGTYGTTGITFFDGLFQNAKTFNFAVGHACELSPYNAQARDGRKLNVSFRESPGDPWEDMPTMNIEHVPFAFSALNAQKVGNHGDGSLLRVENAGNPSAVSALTPTQYTNLVTLANGASTQYVQSVLGTASQITVNTAAGVATVGLADVATAGTYGSATQVPVFTLDAKGRITSVTNTTITGAAPTGAASGDLTGNYPNPDIAALAVGTAEIAAGAVTDAKLASDAVTTVKILDANVTLNKLATDSVNSAKIVDGSIVGADISSTANLSVASVTATGAVSSDSVSTRSIGLFELPVNGTNYVALKAPDNLAGNTTYTWPAAAPGSNMVLQSDVAGNLSWVSAAASSITALTGDVTASGSGSVAATIANDAVTFAKFQNITDNRILGRSAGSAGDMQEITIGTGLSLSAGTLSATATAPGDASYAAKGIVQFDTDAATSGITVAAGVAKLATSGVAANTYGSASAVPVIAVDAFGRITTATTTSIAIAASQVTSGVLDVARGGTGTGTLAANRMFMANGTGSALIPDTCTVGQVLRYDGTNWLCVASTSLGAANAYVQSGNAFGAKAVLGTTDNNDLEVITNNTAKMTVLANGNVGIGTTSPYNKLQIVPSSYGDQSAFGIGTDINAGGYTGLAMGLSAASGGYATIQGIQSSGSAFGNIILNPSGGNIGIGATTPTAALHLKAGSATAGTAPLKLTAGTVLGTPEDGAIEYDGTNLYYTDNTNTRRTLGTSGGITALTGDVTAAGPGSAAATIANSAVTTGKIADDAVTFAKIQNITDNRILGRSAGSSGDMQEITIGTGLSLSAGTLTATATAPGDASYAAKGIVQFDTDAATSGITVAAGVAKLATSGVAANTYGAAGTVPVIAVDAFGRITSATDTAIAIAASQVTSGVLDVARGGTGTGTLAANRMFMANGLGTALVADTCTIGQVLRYDGTNWVCVASTSLGPANAYVQSGNAFGAKAVLGTTDNNDLEFITNNTAAVTVKADGKVGIGTASPAGTFHIAGVDAVRQYMESSTDTASQGPAYFFRRNRTTGETAVDGDLLGAIKFQGKNAATTPAYYNAASVEVFTDGTPTAVRTPGRISFLTTSTSDSGERMRITGAGNVGIGTTSPASALHVDDGFITNGRFGAGGALIMRSAEGTKSSPTAISTSTLLGQTSFRGYDGAAYQTSAYIGGSSDGAITNSSSPGYLSFYTTPSGSTTAQHRMRIDSSGNVGVGTTSANTMGVNANSKVLTISGDGSIAGGRGALELSNPRAGGSIAAGDQAGSIHFTMPNNQVQGLAVIQAVTEGTGGANGFGGSLYFHTKADNVVGVGTAKMVLSNAGKLGIGQTSPTAALHLKAGSATAGTAPLKLTAGTVLGTPEDGAIEYDGTNLFYTDNTNTRRTLGTSGGITALTGDVTAAGPGSAAATIANSAVTTGKIADDAVTFAKFQNITDNRILGRSAGSSGDMQEITIGTGLSLSAGTLSATATAPGDASYAAKGIVQFDTDAATSGITVAAGVAKLATSGVAANTYGAAGTVPVIAVDAFGRITSATDTAIAIAASQVTSGVLDVARGGTGTGTLTANRMFMANGLGTALVADTCTVGQVLRYDGTNWLCVASTSLGAANAYVQSGNAFGAKAVLGTTDNNTLEFITNNTAKMTVLANGNVGVGTVSPSTAFDVAGSLSIGGPKSGVSFTTLSGALASGDTVINVASTANYPSSGLLHIASEVIAYTGKTATTFTGLTRGLYTTTIPASSAGGTTVKGLIANFSPYTTSQYSASLSIYNNNAVVIGTQESSATLGGSSLTAGHNSRASGQYSAAIGGATRATGANAIAVGSDALAAGTSSQAFGNYVTADSYNQATFGAYNMPKSGETAGSWVATDPLFVVGNGTGSGASRSTALMLLKNGNMGLGTTNPTYKLDVNGGSGSGINVVSDGTQNSFANNISHAGDITGSALLTLKSDNSVASASRSQLMISGSTQAGTHRLGIGINTTDQSAYLRTNFQADGTTPMPLIFGVASSEKMRIHTNGQVGIGTTSPTSTLHVVDTKAGAYNAVSLTPAMRIATVNNAAANAEYATLQFHINSQNGGGANAYANITGIQTSTGSNGGELAFGVRTGAGPQIEAMRIDALGKLGIGTTAPSAKLDVKGDFAISGSTSGAVKFAVPAAAGSATYTWPAAAPASNMVLQSNSSGTLSWVTAGGTGDFLANGTVDMTGAFRAAAGTNALPGISFAGDPNTGIYSTGDDYLHFVGNGVTIGSLSHNGFNMNTVINGLGASSASAPAYSFTGAANADTGIFNPANDVIAMSTAGTERMRILADGKVGIGTTTPADPLVIQASKDGRLLHLLNSTASSDYYPEMRISHYRNFTTGGWPIISSYHARGTIASPSAVVSGMPLLSIQGRGFAEAGFGADRIGAQIDFTASSNWGNSVLSTDMIFSTAASGSWSTSERMRILSGGNVGIGTATPGEKLEVNGDVKASGFISTSDRRLKTDIRQMEGLELIRKLNGVRYKWKSNGKEDMGLIAQEVEEFAPEVVVTDKNTGYKAVKYSNLISPLIQATKELDVMCRAVTREVASLKEENTQLKSEVQDLKSRLDRIEKMLSESKK